MSLTPLRFNQTHSLEPRPLYGFSSYLTACRRFEIHKKDDHWHVGIGPAALRTEWFDWFDSVQLSSVQFTTRRAAVEAIVHALEIDGLMDAAMPS